MSLSSFAIGDEVSIKSASNISGYIVKKRYLNESHEYFVSTNSHSGWYSEYDLYKSSLKLDWKKRDAFLCDMLTLKLTQPFSDSLYAYRASRTEFAAYQFRPVLKFLENPDRRILIADEVGLGKTIEACMIYLELKARLNIRQILIVCPSRLRQKWQDELYLRFEEKFDQLDSHSLQQLCNDYERTGGALPFRKIVSYETIRSRANQERLLRLDFKLDLIIMDEAHYMRNRETSTHQAARILVDNADAVVFLTATPLHLGNEDLYNLLNLLSPGEYQDFRIFSALLQPNRYINKAAQLLAANQFDRALLTLEQVENTAFKARFLNNPIYASVKKRIRSYTQERHERVRLQRDLLALNTLSNIFTRTRKREVSSAAVRSAYSIMVSLTPGERRFYNATLNEVRQQLIYNGSESSGFAIVMKERMAASCLGALREKYTKSDEKSVAIHHDSTIYDVYDEQNHAKVVRNASLRKLAFEAGTIDSKFEKLLEVLEEAYSEGNTKILLFSYFRDTLAYLEKHLKRRGYNPRVIHGGIKIVDRQYVIDRFRNQPASRLLLSSEVGSEGLDFQFCGVLINYDMPWNPMQVEQRIGRLDRFGQVHDKIRIYNFYIENTIETRILYRLYDRINIFKAAVGDLEAILGEKIRELSREALQSNLSEKEEEQLANEAANQIARLQLEEEELEDERDKLLGQDALLKQDVQSAIHNGRVIHHEEVRAIVELFLRKRFSNIEFTRDYEDPTWTLTITPELNDMLRQHQFENKDKNLLLSDNFQKAMAYHQQIALSFDNDYARKRPLLEFISYNHLLADLAVSYWRKKYNGIPALRGCEIPGPQSECGEGFFFVYTLDETGIQAKRSLKCVVILENGEIAETTSDCILGYLQKHDNYVRISLSDNRAMLSEAEDIANSWIAGERDKNRHIIKEQNEALVAIRRTTIEQSYEAKIERTRKILNQVSEVRIRRLYEGQIRNLESSLKAKIEEIERKLDYSVSYNLVALGCVRILPQEENLEEIASPEISFQKGSDENEAMNDELLEHAEVQSIKIDRKNSIWNWIKSRAKRK